MSRLRLSYLGSSSGGRIRICFFVSKIGELLHAKDLFENYYIIFNNNSIKLIKKY